MAVRILIGEDDNELVLDTNVAYELSSEITYSDNADAQRVEHVLEIEGEVVEADQGDLYDSMVALHDQVSASDYLGPQRIQIEQDGENKWDFDPANCINSPVLTSFRAIREPGAGVSHWKYRITAKVLKRGAFEGGNQNTEVFEVHTSIAVRSIGTTVVRKTWKAEAKAKTVGAAKAAVLGYKPGNSDSIEGEVEVYPQDSRATGVWVWELKNDFWIEETVDITGGDEIYDAEERIGVSSKDQPTPLFHPRPLPAMRIHVRGVVRGRDPSKLKAPAAHVKEGADVVRQKGLERRGSAVLEDVQRGMWKLDFEEIYDCSKRSPPKLDHSDHKELKPISPPGDGVIGSVA
jgi:hypothetical protein